MTSACFSRANTGFSRNATLVAKVNPPALAGGVFNLVAITALDITSEMHQRVLQMHNNPLTMQLQLAIFTNQHIICVCNKEDGVLTLHHHPHKI